jgi:hypothetical protein
MESALTEVKVKNCLLTSGRSHSGSSGTRIFGLRNRNAFWRASELSIKWSARSAVTTAEQHYLSSTAFPAIGAGSGSFKKKIALEILLNELSSINTNVGITIVLFRA